jgi:2-phospho-L-lactate guanylyltransferase
MVWALVPAKLGGVAKNRLAGALSPTHRADLARAMLSDVLAALGRSRAVHAIATISRDDDVDAIAQRLGIVSFREREARGLNCAVAEGVTACAERGADTVLVVMADLPLLTPSDVDQLLARVPPRGIAAAPSRDGTGTNLLALRPPDAIATSFGPGSLALHRAAAAKRRVAMVTCPLNGAALDVDTIDDLITFARSDGPATAARRVLASAGFLPLQRAVADPS